MPTTVDSSVRSERGALARFVRAGATTAIVDGLFSSVLSVAFYGSTVQRLWQGVATVALGAGPSATAIVGILIHVCVAFGWSAAFLALYQRSAWIQRATSSRAGVLGVAAVYGPTVWLVMSLIVIPLLTHRATPFTIRWWVQLVGHAPCVGLPIVASIAGRRAA
jgi:uncharacterized membrane protein YagU involved in acid resistance